jgi:hypothetical protein
MKQHPAVGEQETDFAPSDLAVAREVEPLLARGKDCPAYLRLVELALASESLPSAEADQLHRHLKRCPGCQGEFASLRQAQEAAPSVPGRKRKRLTEALKKAPPAILVLLALACALVAASATLVMASSNRRLHTQLQQRVREVSELRQALALDRYISFVADAPGHSPTDVTQARPLFVVGSTVVLKGKADQRWIGALEVEVSPGLTAGAVSWKKTVHLKPAPAGQPAPFELRWDLPADGALRVATIRLLPTEAALVADPKGFRPELLTYRVGIACLPAGALAYVRLAQGPRIEGLRRDGDRVLVTVRARTHSGWVTVGSSAGGGPRFVPAEPQQVRCYGQELRFSVQLGAFDEYEIQAFAGESARAEELTDALLSGQTPRVLAGDRRTVQK